MEGGDMPMLEKFGDGFGWGGLTLIYFLRQEHRFNVFDFAYHILKVEEALPSPEIKDVGLPLPLPLSLSLSPSLTPSLSPSYQLANATELLEKLSKDEGLQSCCIQYTASVPPHRAHKYSHPAPSLRRAGTYSRTLT